MCRSSIAASIVLFLLFPSLLWAQGVIGIHSEPEGRTLCVSPYLPLQEYYVVYSQGPPIQSIEFSAPIPHVCFLWTSSWFDDVIMFPNTSGDSQTGVSVDFGQCLSPPVHILSIRLLQSMSPAQDCCGWDIEGVVAIDCNGQPVSIYHSEGVVNSSPCDPILPPHSPSPPDGAESVALTATLEWQCDTDEVVGCNVGEVLVFMIWWGTDPDDLTRWYDVNSPFQMPGGLQPDTRYYWQVASTTYTGAGPYAGPLWTFTTAGPVAYEASTWGRIKALFK